ncbi:bifunctional protein tyrosine phosphatase family protein/NAD(P)/FAD-dependent oxidoreductase [Acetobacter estunensis]|uniref:bifunctional protein tyrosine phosphatase family protein/NAD(P)/FAD-dependent oxidoreductase n=1 Tax=Acetobacter estunensis TaxID=104097 RepID=UPI001C2D73BB|nr:bifunctional protein tyrosine phosphatase family protein/NAD(P)/FAD-dependent oxidoreductase [Acetobacter estunensis]MBV1838062.1 TIGR01244 family phosphatase [Acetobacter estunensis]
MTPRYLTDTFAIAPQLSIADVADAARQGFRAIVCARPDGEERGQPTIKDMERAAAEVGLTFEAVPFAAGATPPQVDVDRLNVVLKGAGGPVLGYCRSGNRAAQLWALAQAGTLPVEDILAAGHKAGVDLSPLVPLLKQEAATSTTSHAGPGRRFDVVIVGGGAGGLSAAASLLRRRPRTTIAIVEPSDTHYYQPGWTLVGGGVFKAQKTRMPEASVMPKNADWIRSTVTHIDPDTREVTVADGGVLSYEVLVIAAGITLNWGAIAGLPETLGRNGVTSNYRYDLAPYTWELVEKVSRGNALFTQPPMPIKCAGAPQKAMYLACDAWRKRGVLDAINVEFDNAGGALFGVQAFVPALMNYVRDYGIALQFHSKLVAVDGERRIATFERTTGDKTERVEQSFEMLHVVPPQIAPAFIRESGLGDASGFVAVDPGTLQHVTRQNVFAIGDSAGTSNAKTAAAVRKQAPVVALNVAAALDGKPPVALYDGYGGCPLTVERGKIVLAEFGYGGKLMPTLPRWILDGQHATRLAWFLKKDVMPPLYREMLRGHEFMVEPEKISRT